MIKVIRSANIEKKEIIKNVCIKDIELVCDCCGKIISPYDMYLYVRDDRHWPDEYDESESYAFCDKSCFSNYLQRNNDFDNNGKCGNISFEYEHNNIFKTEYTDYFKQHGTEF